MTDTEKIQKAYELLRSVRDAATRLFGVSWGEGYAQQMTAGDRVMVEQLMKEYDYDAVRDAFQESRAQKKQTLAYVRVVAKSLHEKRVIEKNLDQHYKMKAEEKDSKPDPTVAKLLKNIIKDMRPVRKEKPKMTKEQKLERRRKEDEFNQQIKKAKTF